MPWSAMASASPSFWQVMPTAPLAICSRASSGILWVLMCGRTASPCAGAIVLGAREVALDRVEIDR